MATRPGEVREDGSLSPPRPRGIVFLFGSTTPEPGKLLLF